MCVCLECGYERVSAGTIRGQQRASDPLELEVQVLVRCLTCVLGADLGPSLRAIRTLNDEQWL